MYRKWVGCERYIYVELITSLRSAPEGNSFRRSLASSTTIWGSGSGFLVEAALVCGCVVAEGRWSVVVVILRTGGPASCGETWGL